MSLLKVFHDFCEVFNFLLSKKLSMTNKFIEKNDCFLFLTYSGLKKAFSSYFVHIARLLEVTYRMIPNISKAEKIEKHWLFCFQR